MIREEVFINGVSVPFLEDNIISITRKITDISEPNKRNTGLTKTIRIPGTKVVNTLFGQIFDLNVEVDPTVFDVDKKADAIIYIDSIEQLSGFARLISVDILNRDDIVYNIACYGAEVSIFSDMGNRLLSELDLSDMNHIYNRTNIVASWTPTLGDDFYYPMIDYKGQTNPDIDTWEIEDFRPAIFAREYLVRIFNENGFTFTSTFLDSDLFKRLIIPAKSDNLEFTAQDITDRSFLVERTVLQTVIIANIGFSQGNDAFIFDDDSTGANFNTITNDYSTTTGIWSVNYSGSFKFTFNFNLRLKYLGPIIIAPASLVFVVTVAMVRRNSSIDEIFVTKTENLTFAGPNVNPNDLTNTVNFADTFDFTWQQGDQIVWTISQIDNPTFPVVDPSLFVIEFDALGTWQTTVNQATFVEGNTMLMSNTAPKMKQKDFFLSIIKMFNLYVEAIENKVLLIEPREDYYTQDIEDWTSKQDHSQILKNIPRGLLAGKRYRFLYKEEKDFLHSDYFDDTQDDYGNRIEDIENDFLTKDKDVKLVFASTLLNIPDVAPLTDRPIPDLRFGDSEANLKEGDAQPRILQFGGLLDRKDWNFKDSGGTTVELTYPFAGDVDEPYSGTFSLNFTTPQRIFYDDPIGASLVAYPPANLYDFHRDFVNAVTTQPVIEGRFFITPLDMLNLSFRPRYFIGTVFYRLLEVKDYTANGLATCRFLKVE